MRVSGIEGFVAELRHMMPYTSREGELHQEATPHFLVYLAAPKAQERT
jgi:hypothetical protein